MSKKTRNNVDAFEQALNSSANLKYQLCLYIAGVTPRSTQALANIKAICEEFLANRYELEVIDIFQQPMVAQQQQIVAAPTLIKKAPPPQMTLIGDMTDRVRILAWLNIRRES